MSMPIRLFAVLALMVLAWSALPAQAQPSASQSTSTAELEKLVATLKDDTARAKLVGQLELLLKAQKGATAKAGAPVVETAADEGAAPAILTAIPDRIEQSVWTLIWHWGGGAAHWLSDGIGRRVVGSVISIASALLITQIIWRVVSGAIRRYLERTDKDGNAIARSRRVRTLLPLLRLVVRVVLTVMVVLIILSELGVNIAPLLAGAGVVGIAVGFGAQKLVQDIITGVFILIEDTISLGDVVSLDTSHSGVVEGMSIRALKLRDASGNLHSVPFSSVGSVTNMSKEFAYAVFDVGIGYGEDVDKVSDVLKEIGAEMQADAAWAYKVLEPLEVLGLDRFDASAVVIKARFKVKALQQWAVMREFNRRMKRRFDADGIEFPFPQTTLWFGEGPDGKAPPAKVRQV